MSWNRRTVKFEFYFAEERDAIAQRGRDYISDYEDKNLILHDEIDKRISVVRYGPVNLVVAQIKQRIALVIRTALVSGRQEDARYVHNFSEDLERHLKQAMVRVK